MHILAVSFLLGSHIANHPTVGHLDLLDEQGRWRPAQQTELSPLVDSRLIVSTEARGLIPYLPQLGYGQVTSVDLRMVQVSDDDLQHIVQLKHIQTLHLGSKHDSMTISTAGLRHLQRLSNLRELTIWNSEIGNDLLSHLTPLTNLHTLRVADPLINDAGLTSLSALPNLQHLTLWDTRITDVGLTSMAAKLQLSSLCINGHRITSDGLAWVQEHSPNTQLFSPRYDSPIGQLWRGVASRVVMFGLVVVLLLVANAIPARKTGYKRA